MFYGRGVQLRELYISPDKMDPAKWAVLGQATRWAVDQTERLGHSVLVGGDPAKGEVVGYVAWLGERGILDAAQSRCHRKSGDGCLLINRFAIVGRRDCLITRG